MNELAEKLEEMHKDVLVMPVYTENQQNQVAEIQKEIEDLLKKVQNKIKPWDRKYDLEEIIASMLKIGSQYDPMDPEHMNWL